MEPGAEESLPKSTTRTFGGRLPEGSKVKRLHADTKTHIEYGEKTWTTAQSVRDILQNHLDAETQRFFDKLLSSVVDTDKLSEGPTITGPNFDDFTYFLYCYKKGLISFSEDAEKQMVDLLNQYSNTIPLRKELLNKDGKLKLDAIRKAVISITETPPKIEYKIKDSKAVNGENFVKWVAYDKLQHPQYSEKIEGSKAKTTEFRYQIVGMKIEDEGSGFDTKLSAFYKSTKRGQRHLRGKFGEGAKMSATHLMRHGASVKMRSRFKINSQEPTHERIWQHRAYVGEENTIEQKGIQVDLPPNTESDLGSYTLITIHNADPIFQQDFRANVDPRIKGKGLQKNCLEYSSARYYYPMSILRYGEKPVGVSLDVSPENQYVQGLRVGSEVNSQNEFTSLFSYNFLDSSVLQGRDRSELKKSIASQINNFWIHADSQFLITELINRIATNKFSESTAPEASVLDKILSRGHDPLAVNDTQARRTTEIALRVFPAIVNAKPGFKNLIVKEADIFRNRDFIENLQLRGFNVITLGADIGDESIAKLNKTHEGNYQFYSLTTANAELQSQHNEMSQDDERVRRSLEIYNSAVAELKLLAEKSGLKLDDFNFENTPHLREVIDPTKEPPFSLSFNDETRKFKLVIRPELLSFAVQKTGGGEYWKRRMQVLLLATFQRYDNFLDQNSLYIASQDTAQEILNKTLHKGQPDVDVLPQSFNYEPQVIDPIGAIKRFNSEQTNIQESLVGWDIYRTISKFQLDLAGMEKVSVNFDQIPEPYRQRVKDIMMQRIVVENGEIAYFDYPEDGKGDLMLFKKSLDSLVPLSHIDGKPVYQLGDKLFYYFDFPKGSVIKLEKADQYNNHTYVMYGGELLDFSEYSFGPYQFNPNPTTIERGGIVIKNPKYSDNLQTLETELKAITITSPERRSTNAMRFLEGIVETPFSSEYGIDEWDKPERVFQDIVQNHLDASPSGKVDVRFEVKRGQERVWITEQEITDSDAIVGLRVTDNGDGYTPNDLGTIGKSSKKSPLFAGKYGEGQKMIAAAAIRNGLELIFSSESNYNGSRYRWEGKVETKPEEIFIGGKPSNIDRVVFNISSKPSDAEKTFTSSTVLRLPEGGSQNSEVWQNWLKVIDPREKNEHGDGGLARYVLPMRHANNERIIDMGYMKILLDRPGELYENGLLVPKKAETALGYDVPEVVSTRERNSYDSDKLHQYIMSAAFTCTNSDYAMTIMQKFKEKYLTEVINNPNGYIKDIDLNFERMYSGNFSSFVPAKPFWKQAYTEQLGVYLVHSEEKLRDDIKFLTEELSNTNTRAERREEAAKELTEAYVTLFNVRHIPSDLIIHVKYRFGYSNWSKVFPTVEEFVRNISEQEIPVSDDIRKALETVVSASCNVLRDTQDHLRSSPDGQHLFGSIITGKASQELDSEALVQIETSLKEQFERWTPEALRHHPGRVFVAPANAGYLGIAIRNRIGFNEWLLLASNPKIEITGTARHELIHKIYGLGDYSPEFIMMLLESAKANISSTA